MAAEITTVVAAAGEDAVEAGDSKTKTQRSVLIVARWRYTLQRIVSPWRPTEKTSQQTGNDRDRGQTIAMPSKIG